MGLWVFWVLGFFGLEFLAKTQKKKTQKLAKAGLAKVGQHSETLKLAKVGLANVDLAKVGHDQRDNAVLAPETDDTLKELPLRRPETVQRAILRKYWSCQRRQFRLTAR